MYHTQLRTSRQIVTEVIGGLLRTLLWLPKIIFRIAGDLIALVLWCCIPIVTIGSVLLLALYLLQVIASIFVLIESGLLRLAVYLFVSLAIGYVVFLNKKNACNRESGIVAGICLGSFLAVPVTFLVLQLLRL